MRTIVHLSDLHFGRVDARLLEPLRRAVTQLAPHVVVVSGDLTQRARSDEFRLAREYLATLPSPQVVVPGNHDIPLYNVFQRFFAPHARHRRFFGADLEPAFVDGEIAVLGVNTARSFTFKDGRINEDQVERIRLRLSRLPATTSRILVTHHPFDVPARFRDSHRILGRAAMAMKMLAQCGADVLLSGHLHATHSGRIAERYRIEGFSALLIQAGTATSTRGRGEANSFNALRVDRHRIEVDEHAWNEDAAQFTLRGNKAFLHTPKGWVAAMR
ncbi:MAG: metallophosphoesterase family protein [Usitatibacter sp.]